MSVDREALALITKTPGIIILDVMMPGMDGFELGADDYLVKPFLPKELWLRSLIFDLNLTSRLKYSM